MANWVGHCGVVLSQKMNMHLWSIGNWQHSSEKDESMGKIWVTDSICKSTKNKRNPRCQMNGTRATGQILKHNYGIFIVNSSKK